MSISLSKRSSLIDSSGIRKVFDLAAKMDNPINLSIGQPDFSLPKAIASDMINAINMGETKYTPTQGTKSLRENILNKYYDNKYSLDEIIITSGVSGGIVLTYLALLDEGDGVMIFDPYFVLYKQISNFFGVSVSTVNTYPDFTITKENLEKSYNSNVKAIIINSPSNPTGIVYTEDEVKIVAEFAKKHDLIVISDEIYDKFYYDKEPVSISNYYDKVVILNGFSKTFAMTGERVGYAIGPASIIEAMTKIQQYTFVCAPSTSQKALENNLEYDFKNIREDYKIKRDIVYEALCDVTHFNMPTGAFYAFPILHDIDVNKFVELSIKNRVLIIPGNIFSEKNNAIRISFAQNNDILKEGVNILRDLLKG